ncbi:MAG: glycosyltransferase family 4 protein [Richelia sp. RM2_1_2]|nr:glycosyltransferase family 4 protein [Richelia sp. SM1_7_0]NJN08809.1 glycosyltransferase family 4 protein [Richelia sp. RM1_1_1]NJO28742.1 glycosyltransferase family 4 protein [Richelia sp. SL_2_1]NJO62458.1 glycosyltransferase family 4 protein [Richelia sp. RM2_1_2]
MIKKLLLVTFPIDLGSTTFEQLFIKMFDSCPNIDLKVYRFAANQNHIHPKSIFTLDYARKFWKRIIDSRKLQKAVHQANSEGRKVLFNGISPAVFAYPAIHHENSYIVTDWTRKLFAPIWGHSGSPTWLTFIHKRVLNSQKYVFGVTDAVIEQIKKDYDVPENKLKKVKLPFASDLNMFVPSPKQEEDEIRILFVGGDFHRKGGDILLNWFVENYKPGLQMTMLTRKSKVIHPKISFVNNVSYGQARHIEIFKNHDIFVLPTKCDAYPSVLGEAACAGLAILTTKNALGAPEIVRNNINGYICSSQEDLLNKLNELINNKSLIKEMKSNSRKLMEKEFEDELVLNEYMTYIFE